MRLTATTHVATSVKWPWMPVYHQSTTSHVKELPTRTSVKLSSANCDMKDTMLWGERVPSSVSCLSRLSTLVSFSRKESGMLLTFSRCIWRPAHSGGTGKDIGCVKSPPRGLLWIWQDLAEVRLKHAECYIKTCKTARLCTVNVKVID